MPECLKYCRKGHPLQGIEIISVIVFIILKPLRGKDIGCLLTIVSVEVLNKIINTILPIGNQVL